MMQLRPYQRASIDALYEHWNEGGGNGLIVIPTGGGKSLIIATLLKEILENYPLIRIGIVTHSRELIVQNFSELLKIWPQAPAGINSAGVGRRDTRDPILFCGVQSTWNKVGDLGRIDLLIIDEAHLIGRAANTMYGKLLAGLRDRQPDLRVVGLTATPYRMDTGRLDEGEDRLFEKVVYDAEVPDLIEGGYLSPLVSSGAKVEIDVKGVGTRGGEFIAGQLEAAAMKDGIVEAAAADIVARSNGRRAWLCFCSGIDHSNAVRDALRKLGVIAEAVDGSMSKGERDGVIGRFRNGQVRCLTSVNVLSIGFNVPQVDLVALLRPTKSAGLYIQQVGRALRKAPGKNDALVLDYAGNVRLHGPIDLISPKKKRRLSDADKDELAAEMRMAAKECPQCMAYSPIQARMCQYCGHEWAAEIKHQAKADSVSVLSGRDKAGWIPVTSVHYYRHTKRNAAPGTPETLRVSYGMGFDAVSSWWCFDHPLGSMPQRKAVSWWLGAGGALPAPASVAEALSRTGQLRKPEAIIIAKDDQGFKKVTQRRYPPRDATQPPRAPQLTLPPPETAAFMRELDDLTF